MRPGEEAVTAALIDRLLYYDVTKEIAKQAGALRYQWRRQGHALSLADATIAAVALHHNLALLTAIQGLFLAAVIVGIRRRNTRQSL